MRRIGPSWVTGDQRQGRLVYKQTQQLTYLQRQSSPSWCFISTQQFDLVVLLFSFAWNVWLVFDATLRFPIVACGLAVVFGSCPVEALHGSLCTYLCLLCYSTVVWLVGCCLFVYYFATGLLASRWRLSCL